ncbi:MAG: bifunctional demethylmenaquinone methyltransferase/2-methoxy-6-polyprenyl-1,4-benzoquinol methylase UbiE [Sulfuricaulis sp.]|jgi:demethylmenaquinone methyltransferase/2-methoxy-6-polyprenyl-1,4-benzoquinol methylase|uniref:bifunctional demethylmenaquinone methyltransferase/2-methoxy-6-polyprenyl-1,4-benzoquinol methylase UbiE n=1 Tax=Sulfuricaulis sp. TaxID=2003553 RepID=UPI002B6DFDBC|nr:bifunctional demethylmenaquinone methyltransferase/2-methoxy-6-polyprenyl-1,4-benzoquinol methylase UbiE [Sulfuricaulis sp.]
MPQPDRKEPATHFGYREVPESAKDGLVSGVFHSVAGKYDLMNDLMSLGIHRLWKQFATEASGVRAGFRVLDVAGGTGDMAARFALRVGWRGQVVLADINRSMLEVGRTRLADQGYAGNIAFVQANAENLPFPDDHFDRVSIAFGLRNVTHIDRALASMFRVLKPGGSLLVLEFSRPTISGLNRLYDAYSFNILPWLGRVIAKDEGSYRYLAESIRKHPDQQALQTMMEQAGFERVEFFNLSGGIVALHRGYKY